LPEPVGAKTSALAPLAIAGQASCCARVGPANVSANHSPTAGAKGSSTARALIPAS
jgi:hypothetical protein